MFLTLDRSQSNHRTHRLLYRLVLPVLLWLTVTGCGQGQAPPAGVTDTPTAAPPTEAEPPPPTAATELRQLVFWVPPMTGLALGDQAGAVLDDAFFQFESANPGVNVDVHVKAEFGLAGMPNFLRSAQQVAPSILPDMIIIRTQQLWQMVDLGLIPALADHEMPPGDDFYPFAWQAVTYRNQVYGMALAADALVMVHDPTTGATPRTWDDLLALNRPLLFAGGSGEGPLNLPALTHYLGAGGELREDGTLAVSAALEAWFGFVATAQAQGLIDPRTLDLIGSEAVWSAYVSQPDGPAFVLTGDPLNQPTALNRTELALLPTQSGRPATVVTTWALAVLTSDPEQRRLALELAETLLAPEVQGLWSRLTHRLPSRRGALAAWTSSDGDPLLLQTLAEHATALPNGRPFAEFARRVQQGQLGLLRSEITVADALQLARAGD